MISLTPSEGEVRVACFLGVHATSDTLWLACLDQSGAAVDISGDYRRIAAKGLESGDALLELVADIRRILRRYDVSAVRLLDANVSERFKYTYQALVPRITVETAVAIACAHEKVQYARMTRAKAGSLLDLPKGTKLHAIATQFGSRMTPHWGPDKRDLALVTAAAAYRDSPSDD